MLIKSAEFDTVALRVADRHAAYQAAINHALDTQFLTADFAAKFKSYRVADQHIIWLEASPRRNERTRAIIESDRQDSISFQYIVEGYASGHAAGRPLESGPRTFLLLDLAQPFVVTDQDRRTIINLAVPRAFVARLVDDPAALHGVVIAGGASVLLADFLQSAVATIPGLSPTSGALLAAAFQQLIALMLRDVEGAVTKAKVDPASVLLDRAVSLIRGRLGARDLTPEWLAAKLNMSRSQLYAIFEGHGGVSKTIFRQRLEGAREALATASDGRRISEIGYAVGFASESHFARAFKTAFGVTPRAYRQAMTIAPDDLV